MIGAVSKWKIGLYLAAIFAAGGISGWVVAAKTTKERMLTPPAPKEISMHFCERLSSRMDLSPEQSQKIRETSERYAKAFDSMRREHGRQIHQAILSRNAEIKGILTPEQQAQFEQIEREHREARDRERSKDRSRESTNRATAKPLS
jgi:Spy/CpxP family protein refolding chaperone